MENPKKHSEGILARAERLTRKHEKIDAGKRLSDARASQFVEFMERYDIPAAKLVVEDEDSINRGWVIKSPVWVTHHPDWGDPEVYCHTPGWVISFEGITYTWRQGDPRTTIRVSRRDSEIEQPFATDKGLDLLAEEVIRCENLLKSRESGNC
jgi:hypothetical protein